MAVLHMQVDAQRTVRLSPRELEVLHLVADGHTSCGMADILFLSKRTVDFHIARVFVKLQVNNRMAALRRAKSLGFLAFEPAAAIGPRY